MNGTTTLTYKYDGMGNRVSKTATIDNGTRLEKNTDYYVHDAQGIILATYRDVVVKEPSTNTDSWGIWLTGNDIYGSARLGWGVQGYWPLQIGDRYDYYTGIHNTVRLRERKPWYSLEYQDDIKHDELIPYSHTHIAKLVSSHLTGQKQYELTDHQGNVLATVSDARSSNGDTTRTDSLVILNYSPAITSLSDYYTFCMLMPGRHYADNSGHTTTATLTVLVPSFVPGTYLGYPTLAPSSYVGYASGTAGSTYLTLNTSITGGGAVYHIGPLTPGIAQSIYITASGSTDVYKATITSGRQLPLLSYLLQAVFRHSILPLPAPMLTSL